MLPRALSHTRSLAFLASLACLTGCGSYGGDGDREIARLGVGVRVAEDDSSRGFIMRNGGDGWVDVGDELMDARSVQKTVFASHDVAWAYGDRFLRSRDAGRTWEDLESKLPEPVRSGPYVLHNLAFADATTGYLAVRQVNEIGFPLGAPFVWVTHDGGESWRAVAGIEPQSQEVGFVLGVRGGVAEIMRHALAGPGVIVEPIDGAQLPVQTVATSYSAIRDGFATVGERGWVAFAVGFDVDVAQGRPIILTSARPGAPWTVQPLPDAFSADFGGLDMCDLDVGLAGGTQANADLTPAIFYTDNGGGTWHPSTLHDRTSGFNLSDVTCVRKDEMYLVTGGYFPPVSMLLESRDGGRNFERSPFPLDGWSQLIGLASNARLR